jgi:hypothetical protein
MVDIATILNFTLGGFTRMAGSTVKGVIRNKNTPPLMVHLPTEERQTRRATGLRRLSIRLLLGRLASLLVGCFMVCELAHFRKLEVVKDIVSIVVKDSEIICLIEISHDDIEVVSV